MKIQIEINSQVIENASKLNFFLKKSYHFYDVVVLTETLQLPFLLWTTVSVPCFSRGTITKCAEGMAKYHRCCNCPAVMARLPRIISRFHRAEAGSRLRVCCFDTCISDHAKPSEKRVVLHILISNCKDYLHTGIKSIFCPKILR